MPEKTKGLNKENKAKRWQERVGTSKRFQKRIAEENDWERMIRWYQNDYNISAGNMMVPPINEVFAFVDADLSLMSFKNPYLTVFPRLSGTKHGAAILEAWLNHQWRELDIKYDTDLELTDTDLVGHGWHKTGYNVKVVGTDEVMKIEDEKVYSMRVSWRDVVFDLSSKKPPKDCRWMAHRIMRPIEDMRKAFPKLKALNGITHPHLREQDVTRVEFKDDILYGILWEVWDATEREVLLFAEDFPDILDTKPWPEYRNEFPFRMLEFHRVPDEPYPLSPVGQFQDQVKEKIKLFAMSLNHVKRWNRQAIVKKGVISEENKSKYMLGIDGSMIEHASPDIRRDMMFMDYGNLPVDIYLLLDRIDQIMRNVSGQPEIERGAVTKTQTRTLGELEFIKTGARGRTDRRVRKYERHLENIAKDLLIELRENFDVEQVAKVVEETPDEVVDAFVHSDSDLPVTYDKSTGVLKFNPSDIKGEYDVGVAAGSTFHMDRQTRRLVLEKVLEIASTFHGPTPPFVQEIIVEILRDYDIPGLETAFLEQASDVGDIVAKKDETEQLLQDKMHAEAEKRMAQAGKVDMETKILQLDALKGLGKENGRNAM